MKKMRTTTLSVFVIGVLVLTGCGGNKASNAASKAASAAATAASDAGNAASDAMQSAGQAVTGNQTPPNCGAVSAVWVNLKTKVYHESGDPMYGKTKHGEYLCPSAAKAQGFRPAGGAMAGKHHHHAKGAADSGADSSM
ncbi:MAG TPA: hypothetical protein VHS56_04055 [Candidatus Cybelea sp.]|jgi:hypothetical protein|nr:hypothetical protein [Candidatus Cybelea sp.]